MLKAELKPEPDQIWINVMSGAGQQPQPRAVHLTLTVTNPSRSDYSTEHPDSGVFRFWVTQDGAEIWRSASPVLTVVTPVSIPAGEHIQGTAVWEIADARKLERKEHIAHGEFVPSSLQAEAPITVDEAQ